MGWKEDLENFALNFVTFGGYAAGQAIGKAVKGSGPTGANSGGMLGGKLGGGFVGARPRAPGIAVLPPAVRPSTSSDHCAGDEDSSGHPDDQDQPMCCDRFKLANGYLVDGATGSVWRLNSRDNVLEEVPRRATKSTQSIKQMLAEMQLKQISEAYANEALGELSVNQRALQLKLFDKRYLQPLRAAVRVPKR